MLPQYLEEVTTDTFSTLVESQVSENQQLDFKQRLVIQSPEQKRELAKDVAAFANTFGGDLVFGIDEDQGTASSTTPFEVNDPDQLERQIRQCCQTRISPPIDAIDIRIVRTTPDAESLSFVVIRVHKSARGPHAIGVTQNRHGTYYARSGNLNYQMNHEQLAATFRAESEDLRLKSLAHSIRASQHGIATEESAINLQLVNTSPLSDHESLNRATLLEQGNAPDFGQILLRNPHLRTFPRVNDLGVRYQNGDGDGPAFSIQFLSTGHATVISKLPRHIYETDHGPSVAYLNVEPFSRLLTGLTRALITRLNQHCTLGSEHFLAAQLFLSRPTYFHASDDGSPASMDLERRLNGWIDLAPSRVSRSVEQIEACLAPTLNHIWNAAGHPVARRQP